MMWFAAAGTCAGFLIGFILPRSKQLMGYAQNRWGAGQRYYFQSLKYFIDQEHDKAADILIDFLEVDKHSIDIYLALGELFRKKGEVGRAIRIHQRLLTNPKVLKKKRQDLELQLAQDYFAAGILDRAEDLFRTVLRVRPKDVESLKCLLKIHEQNKDWQSCVHVAKQLSSHCPEVCVNLAHYYCELSLMALNVRESLKFLKKGLSYQPLCPRILLGQAQLYYEQKKAHRAIEVLKTIPVKNRAFIEPILSWLHKCYEITHDWQDYVLYLKPLLISSGNDFLIIKALCECFLVHHQMEHAFEFLEGLLFKSPSIDAIQYFFELRAQRDINDDSSMLLITQAMNRLSVNEAVYTCHSCGYQAQALFWQCPSCKRWESVSL